MNDQERKAMQMALEALEWIANVNAMDYEYQRKANEPIEVLRQALAQPEPWDTSDMAHRTGGLTVEQSIALEMGIDRGAWSDVPDATKWVDELRGDEDSEQEPVENITETVCALLRKAHDVLSMSPFPLKRQWVSLTDEELNDVAEESEFGYTNLARAIEAALRSKNNG